MCLHARFIHSSVVFTMLPEKLECDMISRNICIFVFLRVESDRVRSFFHVIFSFLFISVWYLECDRNSPHSPPSSGLSCLSCQGIYAALVIECMHLSQQITYILSNIAVLKYLAPSVLNYFNITLFFSLCFVSHQLSLLFSSSL